MGKQHEHNARQKEGSKASVLDQILENLNPHQSEHSVKGYRHGVRNQPNGKQKVDESIPKSVNAVMDFFNPATGRAPNIVNTPSSASGVSETSHDSSSSRIEKVVFGILTNIFRVIAFIVFGAIGVWIAVMLMLVVIMIIAVVYGSITGR